MNQAAFLRKVALCGLLACVGALLIGSAQASASAPRWSLLSMSDTTAQAGGQFSFYLEVRNKGDESADGSQYTLVGTLPEGFTATGLVEYWTEGFECPGLAGSSTIECTGTRQLSGHVPDATIHVGIETEVAEGVSGSRVAHFSISGGGATPDATGDPVLVTDVLPGFGFDGFDATVDGDDEGTPLTAAAAHPFAQATAFNFNTAKSPDPAINDLRPREPLHDLEVDLPPGLVGNLAGLPRCTTADLAYQPAPAVSEPLCVPESQLGTVIVRISGQGYGPNSLGPYPVYNVVPTNSAPVRIGFSVFGTTVMVDLDLRSGSDYGVAAVSTNTPQGLAITGTTLSLWGVPAAPVHDRERNCKSIGIPNGQLCESDDPQSPILRNPTSCTDVGEGLTTTAQADSWLHQGSFVSTSSISHELPGFTYPESEWGPTVGIEACDGVPFEPEFSVEPTTKSADSPSGLSVDLSVPQGCWEADEFSATCQSDLKGIDVTLPEGMTINPSAADGLASCSPSQIGLTSPVGSTPAYFDEEGVQCPDASKIGTVSIETPLLPAPLTGAVYLAEQDENPFASLLAMYLVAEGSGVIVKQAGKIEVGPGGRLTTSFDDAPQTPFSSLHVQLFGGPRGTLRTPRSCGTKQATASLAPWARPSSPVVRPASFEITSGSDGASCPSGTFSPDLSAGTTNPLAGAFSAFTVRVTRDDGTQELGGLDLTLPPGLTARLAGTPYCPDAILASISEATGTGTGELASPSCPAASRLGIVTVGAGAGPNPFYTQDADAYLAGPYKGAPLSVAVVAPAVAGPFDLGSVVVRNALRIDPVTVQARIQSDPLPTELHGIQLDLRDIRVDVDRPGFTLNPTSCDEGLIASTILSTQGVTANPSERFQVVGCDNLAFKPKLSLRLEGKTRRGAHPKLRAVLQMPGGGANIARAQVTLPRTELLENSHIRTICTRVQYAAGECPAGSIYGRAKAISPLLDAPLQGPVYLRSSNHQLPDLVASLDGQIHVDLVGRIDSVHGRLRSTFESVPDAAVSRFVLSMQGGKKGLLTNETELCKAKPKATVLFDGQNGKTHDTKPLVKADCSAAHKRKRAHHRAGRR